ncbi:MAG: hypothetical protein CL849_05810 [Crocinitomicaceae bacterium]|nr:hypothetical protein [Crocinitomicaceae bacterium]
MPVGGRSTQPSAVSSQSVSNVDLSSAAGVREVPQEKPVTDSVTDLAPPLVEESTPSQASLEEVTPAPKGPELASENASVSSCTEGDEVIDADLAIVLGKPKVTVRPTGNLAGLTGGKSMLIALEDQERDTSAEFCDTSGLDADYDVERIKKAWVTLAEDLRRRNKVGLAATLANGDFEFADPTIRFTVANDVQFEELKECSTELLHFIRTEVGNGSIALDVQVSKVEAPVEFIAPKDRYLRWASENPALEVIRKRLDLDIS